MTQFHRPGLDRDFGADRLCKGRFVDHFLDQVGKRLGFCASPEIGEEVFDLLCRYRWPGNVRELEGIMERLSVEAGDGGVIGLSPVRRETELEEKIAPGEIEDAGSLTGSPLAGADEGTRWASESHSIRHYTEKNRPEGKREQREKRGFQAIQ